jgi:hypothetical protein
MPATFLYLMAFGAWLCLAGAVWVTAVCLAILPITRRVAGSLALAMAATFPAVFVFQIVAAPLAVLIFGLGLLGLWWLGPGGDPAVGAGLMLAILAAEFLLIGGMSLLGFYEGWRAGWMVSKGQGLGGVLARGPTARLVRALKGRRRR